MSLKLYDNLKEQLSHSLDTDAFSFWAVTDKNLNIIINMNFEIVNDAAWKRSLSRQECDDLQKQFKLEEPVKIYCTENYAAAIFYQTPQLYLLIKKTQNNRYLQCLAELLYTKLSWEPVFGRKLEEFDQFLNSLIAIPISKENILTGKALEKLFEIIHEQYNVKRIAIYTKKKPYDMNSFLFDLYPRYSEKGKVMVTPKMRSKLNFRNILSEDGNLIQKGKSIRVFFNNQRIFFVLSCTKKQDLSIEERELLKYYLQLFLMRIFPFLETTVNWYIAQELIGSLSMEIYDSVTSARFLIGKLQNPRENSQQDSSPNVLDLLEKQIYNLEYKISAYAKRIFYYEKEFSSININSLVKQALQQHPDLEMKCTVNLDLNEDLFISVNESAMLAVLSEIIKNILQHAFTDAAEQDKKKKIVEITGKRIKEQEYLKLVIRDFGKGLDNPAEINNVFEPGWKANKLSPNAGMGLCFAYYVITNVHSAGIRAETLLVPEVIESEQLENNDPNNDDAAFLKACYIKEENGSKYQLTRPDAAKEMLEKNFKVKSRQVPVINQKKKLLDTYGKGFSLVITIPAISISGKQQTKGALN